MRDRFIKVRIVMPGPEHKLNDLWLDAKCILAVTRTADEFAKIGAASVIHCIGIDGDFYCVESCEDILGMMEKIEVEV